MLNEIAEWYRTTELRDNDERLIQRRQAADQLVGALEKASSSQIVDAVCLGLEVAHEERGDQNRFLTVVLDAIVDAQPSFDRVRGATSLEARLCILAAVSELLSRRLSKTEALRRKEPAMAASLAICCALRHRDSATGHFLEERLADLLAMAEKMLMRFDRARRGRTAVGDLKKAELPDGDIGALRDAAATAIAALESNAQLDREELQALWWVFGQYSTTMNKPFAALNGKTAGLVAGFELSQIVAGPATVGMAALAARNARAAANSAINDSMSEIDAQAWSQCIDASEQPLIAGRGAVFPFLTTAATDGHKTPASSLVRSTTAADEIASQVFSERSLLRLLGG